MVTVGRSKNDVLDLQIGCFFHRHTISRSLVDWVVVQMRELFSVDEVCLAAARGHLDALIDYGKAESSVIEAAINSKQLVLSDCLQRIFTCVIESAESPLSRDLVHDEVVVFVNQPIAVCVDFKQRVLSFMKALAIKTDCDFCYACDISSGDYRYERRSGLKDGLRDVYWINIFGQPFLDLIGQEKLLKLCSAGIIEMISESKIMVCLNEPRGPTEQQNRVRSEIGEDYFVPRSDARRHSASQGGSFGISGLAKHLLNLGRSEPRRQSAKRVPKFR